MNIKEYFGPNFEFGDLSELVQDIDALMLAESLTSGERDTLAEAWEKGLMESGDTPSKVARETLLQKKILCQTCWERNDYAFSVTYPLGWKVWRALSVVV